MKRLTTLYKKFYLLSLIFFLPGFLLANPTKASIEMVLVKAGSFQMGSNTGFKNERPVHLVTISKDFYISNYEITYDLYDQYTSEVKIQRASPDVKIRGQRPVEGANWLDAVKFANWLSSKDGYTPVYEIKGRATICNFSANGYRLPTEAEWEYAARGGHKSQGYLYSGSNNPDEVAWYESNSGGEYHVIGLKKPNEIGVYDMNGNMWEWVWDWYDPTFYSISPKIDPRGPKFPPKQVYDPERARRGGRWLNLPKYVRVSSRSADFSMYEGDNGIRLVRTAQ